MKKFLILFFVVFSFQIAKADSDAAWGGAIYFFFSFKLVILLILAIYLLSYFKRDLFSKTFLFFLPILIPFFQFLYNCYLYSSFGDTIDLLSIGNGIIIFLIILFYFIVLLPYYWILLKINHSTLYK